ncbi:MULTISPECIES: TIGR02281 family clan AA aspartic protease [Halomonadaceae]|uniref:retropepsin-like aspartic protease family protein n=1 Tax=Halomonadaceae TaxID=28256 RepID=UPI001598668D|nr:MULTISPECIES: TIGR02281 family clan AA aspartic protease [Halomonas]QJQ94549.1 TIGR02281 family clan AA aspartic protease [Halomonas sp. PA5]
MSDDKSLRRAGLGMMLLFWMLTLAMGTWWFQGVLEERRNPNANLVHLTEGDEPVTLQRNMSGHFVATGRINGEPVEFLIDTGATYVSVSSELAEQLGLEPGRSASFHTANGMVEGFLTELDQVSLGGLTALDLRGSINPGMGGDTALLGMSFLNRFDIEIRGPEMVLRPAQR